MGRKQNHIMYEDLTLKGYSGLTASERENIDILIQSSLKPNEVIRIGQKEYKPKYKDFWQMPWGDLLEIEEFVREEKLSELITFCYAIPEQRQSKINVFNLFSAYRWILNQISEIRETENKVLSRMPSEEEKAAGVEDLAQFGYALELDMLAGGNVLLYEDLLKQPYAIIFRKKYLEKVKNEIQENYLENVNRKIQRNM